MKVYVIAGKAGCGKNTSANYMKKYYESIGKSVVITEISKYLKLFAYEIKNWDGERETKPRTFLQEVGSLIRHELFNDNFFINRFLEDMKVYEKFVDVVIVADARFPKEIESIKKACNSISIEVINEFSEYEIKGKETIHETEVALDSYDNYDYIVHNKTFRKLEEDLIKIVKEVEDNEE